MVRLKHLTRSIFSGRIWRKLLRNSIKNTNPPSGERNVEVAGGFAQASALAAAWWMRSESVINDDLQQRRDARLAARLRGALETLVKGQIDDEVLPYSSCQSCRLGYPAS